MDTAIGDLIETTPGVRGGQPRIAGTRMTVGDLAILYTRLGLTAEEIAGKHGLSPASVHAALSYYYSHRSEIDGRIAEDDTFAASVQSNLRGPLADKLKALIGE